MEYVPLGSLREFLPKHPLSLSHLLLFAQQICEVSPEWGWMPKKWDCSQKNGVEHLKNGGYGPKMRLNSQKNGAERPRMELIPKKTGMNPPKMGDDTSKWSLIPKNAADSQKKMG